MSAQTKKTLFKTKSHFSTNLCILFSILMSHMTEADKSLQKFRVNIILSWEFQSIPSLSTSYQLDSTATFVRCPVHTDNILPSCQSHSWSVFNQLHLHFHHNISTIIIYVYHYISLITFLSLHFNHYISIITLPSSISHPLHLPLSNRQHHVPLVLLINLTAFHQFQFYEDKKQ